MHAVINDEVRVRREFNDGDEGRGGPGGAGGWAAGAAAEEEELPNCTGWLPVAVTARR